jgi:hypothetical protein
MILLKLIVFALGVLLIWAGMPTFGGGLVFSLALNEFCNEFGHQGRR